MKGPHNHEDLPWVPMDGWTKRASSKWGTNKREIGLLQSLREKGSRYHGWKIRRASSTAKRSQSERDQKFDQQRIMKLASPTLFLGSILLNKARSCPLCFRMGIT
ncbi:hypothetical protein Acr_00g0003250 [Actinidia rufa]|uniref:Uncharacterized protein n=1 Tax=Actinidia rufa TaxID=165716 RepID=A0A7J0D6E2_9ERIC|nr:hypothetical protein Acr_00g0000910 [Actinidia rufa]GFS28269.1 hypothetical protein Acr_00g0000940 [Actinidia rufa]GFS28679.1 hypothetical protein Acr_00g0003250 [Actinidia rufa]